MSDQADRFEQILTEITGLRADVGTVKIDLGAVKTDLLGVRTDLIGRMDCLQDSLIASRDA
jgi:hypothetical protein